VGNKKFDMMRKLVDNVAQEMGSKNNVKLKYEIGNNGPTQTALGISLMM